MAVLFTDNFNRANGGLGANWTDIGAAPAIVSNQCAFNADAVLSYWNGGTPDADCYAKCVASTLSTNPGSTGLVLRFNTGTFSGYYAWWHGGGTPLCRIARIDGGTPVTLGTSFAAPSAGQTVEFSIVGSTLSVYYNGALQATRSDSTYTAAGRAGIQGLDTTGRIDDFEVGTPGDPPTIDTHPSNDTVTEGEAGEFTAAATGEDSVQWQFNDGGGWEDVDHGSGDETDTYSTGTTTLAMDGWQYRAAYTNDHGTTYTNAATLTVEAEPTKGIRIQLHDGSTEQANVTGITALWWDGTTPSSFGSPVVAVSDAATDADGWLELDLDEDTLLDFDDLGFLLLYKAGDTAQDDLIFAGRLAVEDIS